MRTVSKDGSRATRDRLLDAAEAVVTRHGATALTLEAVAAEAGVSKGGLLYHFPAKDQLATALVERAVRRVDEILEAASASGSPGAFTREYVAVTLGHADDDEPADRLSAALLGALAIQPSLLDPLRDAYSRWQARLEQDGIDPATTTLVRLAVDGWWMSMVIGLSPLAPALAAAVRSRLLELASTQPIAWPDIEGTGETATKKLIQDAVADGAGRGHGVR